MLIKLSTYERVAENLLKGQPKAKPFGKLKTKSLHWTKQSRNLQLFWRIKRTHRQLEEKSLQLPFPTGSVILCPSNQESEKI